MGLIFSKIALATPGGTTTQVLLLKRTSCSPGPSYGPVTWLTELSGRVTSATCQLHPNWSVGARHHRRALAVLDDGVASSADEVLARGVRRDHGAVGHCRQVRRAPDSSTVHGDARSNLGLHRVDLLVGSLLVFEEVQFAGVELLLYQGLHLGEQRRVAGRGARCAELLLVQGLLDLSKRLLEGREHGLLDSPHPVASECCFIAFPIAIFFALSSCPLRFAHRRGFRRHWLVSGGA